MARRSGTRGAHGSGTIRKKNVIRNGQKYTYWEARITTGYDPGTGKQIQRSFSGKTQKEVLEKMQAAAVAVNEGTYSAPSKMTLGEWLDIWEAEYLGDVKPFTVASYRGQIRNHIKPALGSVRLEALAPHDIQKFYNDLGKSEKGKQGLSAKTIKNIHGVLHKALQQAVENQYIRINPADVCKLPRREKVEFHPLDEQQIPLFLEAVKGHRFEALYTVTLFTGMRKGEAMGLQWSCINFQQGTITINKQLQQEKKKNSQYVFASLKNGKSRTISPAPWVMEYLKKHKARQAEAKLRAGPLWEDHDLVFTDDCGCHLKSSTVYNDFKRIVASIGCPDVRFHDLRHSYAVAAISAGDDIKTVQSNLGHATAAFTLDVYGHVTDRMKQASAERMEEFIKDILKL